jgi:hypothetical protein
MRPAHSGSVIRLEQSRAHQPHNCQRKDRRSIRRSFCLHKRLAAGRPADHRMTISITNGRKLGVYITSTSCTCKDARCWWSRLKLRTSAPGLRHSEEARADSHSVTARSRSWSGNNVRRVGRNSPPRRDRQLEFGHEPTRDTAHSSSSRFGGFWNAPPREVSAPPVFATARRIWIDS